MSSGNTIIVNATFDIIVNATFEVIREVDLLRLMSLRGSFFLFEGLDVLRL